MFNFAVQKKKIQTTKKNIYEFEHKKLWNRIKIQSKATIIIFLQQSNWNEKFVSHLSSNDWEASKKRFC